MAISTALPSAAGSLHGFMVHIKDPLLLNENSIPFSDDSRFSLLLIALLPYVQRHVTVNKMC